MIRLSPLSDPVLREITDTIVARVRPRRVVLFGSRARGNASSDSDYDLMVETDGRRQPDVLEAVIVRLMEEHDWDVDVIVTTPEQYAEGQDDVGLLAYQIAREGVVL